MATLRNSSWKRSLVTRDVMSCANMSETMRIGTLPLRKPSILKFFWVLSNSARTIPKMSSEGKERMTDLLSPS